MKQPSSSPLQLPILSPCLTLASYVDVRYLWVKATRPYAHRNPTEGCHTQIIWPEKHDVLLTFCLSPISQAIVPLYTFTQALFVPPLRLILMLGTTLTKQPFSYDCFSSPAWTTTFKKLWRYRLATTAKKITLLLLWTNYSHSFHWPLLLFFFQV